MPVPVAISSVSGRETPRMRPITSVATNVRTMLPTITTIVRRPRSPTMPRLRRMPEQRDAMRRIRREATRMPGSNEGRMSRCSRSRAQRERPDQRTRTRDVVRDVVADDDDRGDQHEPGNEKTGPLGGGVDRTSGSRRSVRARHLRQPGRAIGIAPAQHREALGDELRGHDERDRRELLAQPRPAGSARPGPIETTGEPAAASSRSSPSTSAASGPPAWNTSGRDPQRGRARAVAQVGGAVALRPQTRDLLELQRGLERRRRRRSRARRRPRPRRRRASARPRHERLGQRGRLRERGGQRRERAARSAARAPARARRRPRAPS